MKQNYETLRFTFLIYETLIATVISCTRHNSNIQEPLAASWAWRAGGQQVHTTPYIARLIGRIPIGRSLLSNHVQRLIGHRAPRAFVLGPPLDFANRS